MTSQRRAPASVLNVFDCVKVSAVKVPSSFANTPLTNDSLLLVFNVVIFLLPVLSALLPVDVIIINHH